MELKEFIERANTRMLTHPVFDEMTEPEFKEWGRDYLKRESGRIRVAVIWAGCDALGCQDWETAVDLAASVELTHNWTLVEDDWMDRDPERRGEPTLHILRAGEAKGFATVGLADHYGQTIATLITNLLQSASSRLFATTALKLDDPKEAIDYYEAAASQVARGQLLDFSLQEKMLKGDLPTEGQIWEMMLCKTASLFRLCGWLAATVSKKEASEFAELGHLLGRLFQLRDDLNDTVPEIGATGQMGDVLEMKPTLFNVRLLSKLTEQEREEWHKVVISRSEVGALAIVDKMSASGIIATTKMELDVMFEDLKNRLTNLPDSAGKEFLLSQLEVLQIKS